MKITFLGSGGGRFSAITQKRMTGGFRIDNLAGKNYHIDPGPGALIRSYQFGFDPRNISGIFVSHAHTDHYNDAEILIEAMTNGMIKDRGIIMGSPSVIDGFENWGPCISKYHKSKSNVIVFKPGTQRKLDGFSIKGCETKHGDPTGVGFQLDYKGFKLSYTSDTGYFEDLAYQHQDADILIASVLRPNYNNIEGHMDTNAFIRLINEIRPKLAIMTHLGLKMRNPIEEAKKISKKTHIRTLAAFDGMSFDVNFNNPSRIRFVSLKDVNAPKHSGQRSLYENERKYAGRNFNSKNYGQYKNIRR